MSIELEPPLENLADWVRATDPRAALHLPLLRQAQRILAGREEATDRQRRELAERLQRWRYEQLDAWCQRATMVQRQRATMVQRQRATMVQRQRATMGQRRLVDALDLAANRLARRDARPARWPREAVGDVSSQSGPVGLAAGCLDRNVALEELARRAAELTRDNFSGPPADKRRMLLYAPLYLSSHCANHCVYCGFRRPQAVRRRHLTPDEAIRQAEILQRRGLRHILLVAGDAPGLTTTEYYTTVIRALAERGISPAVEIAPQTTSSYAELAAAGACGVALYQETYNEQLYTLYHPRGSKASYDWRLEGLERAAEAGMQRLGLGILLGLADPREDLLAMIRHAGYLQDRFPDRTLAFSLPQIHQAPEGFHPPHPVDDEMLVRLYCALRIALPRVELVLSTREAAPLRDRLARICITQLSAGSSTVPGGYEDGPGGYEDGPGGYEDGPGGYEDGPGGYEDGAAEPSDGGQFPVSDRRSPAEVARVLEAAGLEVAWSLPAR